MAFKIYTTPYCPFCVMAKNLLNQKAIAFTEIDVSQNNDLRQELTKLTGMRTVPQIFFNEKPLGGYTDLYALNESGELDKLLTSK